MEDALSIEIEVYIEQVIDGKEYKGTIRIGENAVYYTFEFVVPIPELDQKIGNRKLDVEEIQKLFPIKIFREEEATVDLNEEEYGLFFTVLSGLIVQFYNLPQTRGSNKGVLGDMLLGIGDLVRAGAEFTIGATKQIRVKLPDNDFRKALNQKFGFCLSEIAQP